MRPLLSRQFSLISANPAETSQEREDAAVSEHAVTDAFAWGSIVEGGPLDTESELDRRLSVGASISCRVRGAIREKLGEKF